MKLRCWLLAGAAAVAVAGAVLGQDGPPPPRPAVEGDVAADGLLDAADLDALLGPIALYPDPLLTQIFVASTFPLDLVKADRWVAANADLAADARSAAAEAEGWDPSVAVLAAGFPSVVQRMAADLDSTETLGDAVLAQTDDVLDSVQRLRAQAAATGYLDSNEAQTVTEGEEGEIAIAPADPEVVYVPSYDPAMAYTTAPTAPTYVTTDPVYTQPGYSTGSLLTTGAIAFGSAMLVNEIFEDDDDDWDDYWGPGSIDWDDDEFYHRPDIDIEGDVNIDRDRVVIDRDRTDIDRDRIGSLDPDRVRDGSWQPDPAQRDEARANLEQRQATRERPAGAAWWRACGAAGAARGRPARRASARPRARRPARARRGRSSSDRRHGARAAPPRKATMETPFSPKREGAPKVNRAHERGAGSVSASRSQAAAKAKSKSVAKASHARPAAHRSAAKSTAFKKPKSGGAKAHRSSSRGKASHARRGGGGGGRRR